VIQVPAPDRVRMSNYTHQTAPTQFVEQAGSAATKDSYACLKKVTQPTLVVNGSHDVIVYTGSSFILQQSLKG
jgi:hypothetical protein